ncbi:WxL domain-containing protein [Candidatus Enterococcus mansonii]|uniref:WxL domain-containing protein n=1 Tax=Candidatus Enterococcus mansonii TaxID=1834181 RepID=A0A242CJ52_9ENTE|nr:WxL domain-containing protein [Enterococcus sp. 4G2_DIV0659]OTO10148.1 hypothetical protein A5880_000831 [Enterococcus sp. 4G2_DIV0659]
MKIGKKIYAFVIVGLLFICSMLLIKGTPIKATPNMDTSIHLEERTNQEEKNSENKVYFSLNVKSAKKDQKIILDYSDGITFDKNKLIDTNKEKGSLIKINQEKSQIEVVFDRETQEITLDFEGTVLTKNVQTIQAFTEKNRSNQLKIKREDLKAPADQKKQERTVDSSVFTLPVPVEEGWTEIFTSEEAIIPAGANKELRYGFGPTDALGTTSISGNRERQFAIPNVTFMDNDQRIQHIYHTPTAITTHPEDFGQSLWTSYGLIYAYGNSTKPTVFNTGSHITSDGYKYYKRVLPNGMTIYKLTYESAFDSKKIHVEITMTGKTTGTVSVEYTVTNIGTAKETDFVIGSMIDTELNKNDQVPIYAIGDNKGVYIKDSDDGYKLQYLFTGTNHVANWTGKHWIQGSQANPRDHFLDQFFNFDDSGFSALSSTGYETENYPADQLVYVTSNITKMDTAIYMKNQPASLEVNQGTKMTYDVTIGLSGNPPEVFIDQADQELLHGNAFDVTGQWSDSESPFVDLYYTVDDGTPVKFGDKLANDLANPGKKFNWKFTLPSSVLTVGERTIKVYAVDSEGHTSEEKILRLTIKPNEAKLTIKFVDEANNTIHPDVVLNKKVGSFVNLTKEPDVVKAVNEQLQKQYVISSKPTPEDSIEVLENGRTETYHFKGRIVLLSAPKEIDFGTQIVKAQESVIEEPVRIDGALVIQDSRATKQTWRLQARMKQELTNANNEVVTNAVRYMYNGNEVILNSGMQDVAVGKNTDGSPNKVSDKWSAKGDGFKLKTQVGAVKESGSYTGIIEWELFDGPP